MFVLVEEHATVGVILTGIFCVIFLQSSSGSMFVEHIYFIYFQVYAPSWMSKTKNI